MSEQSQNGLESRRIAFQLLAEVLTRKSPLDQVLVGNEAFQNLDSRDRNFVRMLVSTCLRRKGQIDDLIHRTMDQDRPLHPPQAAIVLSIGICQILFMNVPHHAAVDTTVELAKSENMSRQKGFINAVLRKISSSTGNAAESDIYKNFPDWLITSWREDYGDQAAQEIAMASLTEPALDLSVKDIGQVERLAGELEARILPTNSLRLSGGTVPTLEGFEAGEWWVQDFAASLPVKLAGDVGGRTVFDFCAAPGGKTMQLAAAGAHVTAIDRSASRMKRLEDNLARTGLAASVNRVVADATSWMPEEQADIIL